MKKTQFPATILVSIENEGQGEDQYFNIKTEPSEVVELNEPKRVAYYKFVEEGTVEASAQYTPKKRR